MNKWGPHPSMLGVTRWIFSHLYNVRRDARKKSCMCEPSVDIPNLIHLQRIQFCKLPFFPASARIMSGLTDVSLASSSEMENHVSSFSLLSAQDSCEQTVAELGN